MKLLAGAISVVMSGNPRSLIWLEGAIHVIEISFPVFCAGDDSFAYLVVKVTDYSELDDW